MSNSSNWNYTAKITFWSVAYDEWGQQVASSPVAFDCSYVSGGKLARDNTGAEFVPGLSVYFEADTGLPSVGDKCAIGDLTTMPDTAETVRVVRKFSSPPWDDGLPDYVVLTG